MLSATARALETSGGLPSVSVSDTFTGGVSGGGDAWYFALVLNAGSPAQSTLSYLNNVNQLPPLTPGGARRPAGAGTHDPKPNCSVKKSPAACWTYQMPV